MTTIQQAAPSLRVAQAIVFVCSVLAVAFVALRVVARRSAKGTWGLDDCKASSRLL
jgi:hypothetical protein